MLKRIILIFVLVVLSFNTSAWAETNTPASDYPDIPWTYTEGANRLGEIILAQDKYITAGYDGIKVSSDLENWETVVSVNGEQYIHGGWPAIEYNGSVFVATGLDGGVYTSTDGCGWSFYDRPFNFDISEIIWDGSRFVAVGQYGREKFQEDMRPAGIIVSSDGLHWEKLDVSFDMPWGLNHIAFNGEVYVVDGISELFYSYDLKNWNACEVDYAYNEGIEWVVDRFIATRGEKNILYSYDGINWQSIDQSWGNTMWACAYNGNIFVSVGSDGTIYVSYDGLDWICKTEWHRTDNALYDIIWTGERFVALGSNNNLSWIPDDIIKVKVNGSYLIMDAAPILVNDRTLLPIRAISEALGADVAWDEGTATATITHGKTILSVKSNEATAQFNGSDIELDVPARISNDRMMLPLRFIAEHLGASVDWDESNKTVLLEVQQ